MTTDQMIRALVPGLDEVKGEIVAYTCRLYRDGRRAEFIEVRRPRREQTEAR